MLIQGNRPRELHWYHAGPMLFGDWGTSRLYVLGLCFFYTKHASLWFMLAMSGLLLGVGWAYQIICRLYPDGGGVYSSARERSPILGMIGGLLLCADYIVTAAISALDAFHYVSVPHPHLWAAGCILFIGMVNYFGPKLSGTLALVIALLTVTLTLLIAVDAFPPFQSVHIEAPAGNPFHWWVQFTYIILAISGVEAVANMTGIMVEPVEKTSRRSIIPVMIEIILLNLILTLAIQATPLEVLGDGNPANAYTAHRDDMLRLLAEYHIGPLFAMVTSVVFAFLLLSAVNTSIMDLSGIQYMMSRDRELPAIFGGLNHWGMPMVPLVLAVLLPMVIVILVPDVAHLADLYAIGVVGAITINLGTCSTNSKLNMKSWERSGMLALAIFMLLAWLTIAWEKPWALFFAISIVATGLAVRWVTHHHKWLFERFSSLKVTPVAKSTLLPTEQFISRIQGAYTPKTQVMVATRGNIKLLRFAIEQAKFRQALLLILFVRHLAGKPMGSAGISDINHDLEAQTLFKEAQTIVEQEGVPFQFLYVNTSDIAEAILDLSATHGADWLILGATQRGALWHALKGDVIQQVARYLPEGTALLIYS
ncbi:MAG: amino acid permease [Planctomycetota bacterium]